MLYFLLTTKEARKRATWYPTSKVSRRVKGRSATGPTLNGLGWGVGVIDNAESSIARQAQMTRPRFNELTHAKGLSTEAR